MTLPKTSETYYIFLILSLHLKTTTLFKRLDYGKTNTNKNGVGMELTRALAVYS